MLFRSERFLNQRPQGGPSGGVAAWWTHPSPEVRIIRYSDEPKVVGSRTPWSFAPPWARPIPRSGSRVSARGRCPPVRAGRTPAVGGADARGPRPDGIDHPSPEFRISHPQARSKDDPRLARYQNSHRRQSARQQGRQPIQNLPALESREADPQRLASLCHLTECSDRVFSG